VRAIQTIAISHADLDHYSAVLELSDAFDVDQVLITPQFMAEAQRDPLGPAAHLLEGLTRRRIAVFEVASGHVEQVGPSRLTWLNPRPEQAYRIAERCSVAMSRNRA
jgi:glyoxylase-like metal-dependent hydrolase (beta-lactamase superfamily II)